MTTWGEFAARLIIAFFLGIAIGMEKRWRKAIRIVKISTLLSVSAATYTIAINNSILETNYIILGISLICASIIIQKQANFQSIESAITLWCSGIIGLLIGSGLFLLAYSSTLAIILAKFIFDTEDSNQFSERRIQDKSIDSTALKKSKQGIDEPIDTLEIATSSYRCQIICDPQNEANILASMVQSVQEQNIMLTGLQSNNESLSKVEINAEFTTNNNHHQIELQKIFQNIKLQTGVNSVSWHQDIDR